MRTTINLDEQLIREAQRLTGTQERTALIHDGLRALIAVRARGVWRVSAEATQGLLRRGGAGRHDPRRHLRLDRSLSLTCVETG